MVWTIDMDDYLGTFCNQGKYPLINVLKKALNLEQACKTINILITDDTFKLTWCFHKNPFTQKLLCGVFQPAPLLPLNFHQSQEWARLLVAALEEAPVEAPVVAAPPVGDLAPVAWTAVSALERPTACTPTQQTRTNSTTAAPERPTLSTVPLVWSLTAPVLVATGPKSEVINWLDNCCKPGWLCFTFVLSSQRLTILEYKVLHCTSDVQQCKTWEVHFERKENKHVKCCRCVLCIHIIYFDVNYVVLEMLMCESQLHHEF